MLRCNSCSAPLRPNNANCEYCGVRNPLDLTSHDSVQTVQGESDRNCPDCQIPLKQLNLNINGDFIIEQCDDCFGLFFDHQELEQLLNHQQGSSTHINLAQLDNVNKDRHQSHQAVKYRRCPVCNEFMARRNYGYRSGVVVDRCPAHGEWLDNGELVHLMEWHQSGGQVLAQQKQQQAAEQAKRPPPQRNTPDSHHSAYGSSTSKSSLGLLDSPLTDVLYGLFRVLFK